MRTTLPPTIGICIALGVLACSDPIATLDTIAISHPANAVVSDGVVIPASSHYRAEVLPNGRGGRTSIAYRINDSGVVAGAAEFTYSGPTDYPPGEVHCIAYGAAIWRDGKLFVLHAMLARDLHRDPCYSFSWAVDVSKDGTVTGIIYNENYEAEDTFGFVWSESLGSIAIRRLGRTYVAAINDADVVVGHSFTLGSGFGGEYFTWSPTDPQHAAPISTQKMYDWETVSDINDGGQMLVCSDWNISVWPWPGDTDLWCGGPPSIVPGTFEDYLSGGLNNIGDAVFTGGRSYIPTPYRWFVGDKRPTPLPWAPGGARGISDSRRIIGWHNLSGQPSTVAITQRHGEGVSALPAARAGDASLALGVNRCGDIVGYTQPVGGLRQAVIWKKTPCDPSP